MNGPLTIDRIIHVKDWETCLPAIVTSVGDKHITATIFGPLHTALSGRIKHGVENDDWHWPNECAGEAPAPTQASPESSKVVR